jgi:hypothetical protein
MREIVGIVLGCTGANKKRVPKWTVEKGNEKTMRRQKKLTHT